MNTDVASLEGRVIAGRYRVVGRLGVGGMGSVWLVQHTESLQRLALKTLHLRASLDRNMVERFLREARAAASLHSRNVVKVVDAQTTYVDPETAYPCPFIVMELLEGSNLEQRLRGSGPMTASELLWCFQQTARALDLAHAKGIVHRDLKPENLFLHVDREGDGTPILKVCDFGIAKLSGGAAMGLMDTGAMGTDAQMLFGTPLYMSPEQARSSKSVSPTTDQWAMALIAFRLLTNVEYFSGAETPSDLLMKIISDDLVTPSMRTPLWPAALDPWFLKSLERNPEGRWSSVGAQALALGEALVGVVGSAPKFDVRALPASEPPPSTVREKGLQSGSGRRSGPIDPMLDSSSSAMAPVSQPSSFRSGSNPTIAPASHDDRFRLTVEPSSKTNRTAAELANATRRVDRGAPPPARGKIALAAAVLVAILFGSYMLGRRHGPGEQESAIATPTQATSALSGAPVSATATVSTTMTTTATMATAAITATATAATTATATATSALTNATSAPTLAPTGAPTAASTFTIVKPKPLASASVKASATATSSKKAAGASCERSSECESGLCTAFTCR